MMVVISIGNGAIANEVLKKTKGHALGLGFVAIAFGMAFFLAISMFGHISANVMFFFFLSFLFCSSEISSLGMSSLYFRKSRGTNRLLFGSLWHVRVK